MSVSKWKQPSRGGAHDYTILKRLRQQLHSNSSGSLGLDERALLAGLESRFSETVAAHSAAGATTELAVDAATAFNAALDAACHLQPPTARVATRAQAVAVAQQMAEARAAYEKTQLELQQ